MKIHIRPSEGKKGSIWLLHGFTESSSYFANVIDRPEFNLFNLFIPDLPGFGASALEGSLSIDDVIDELCSKIAESEPPIYLLGHSLGGTLVTLAAVRLLASGVKTRVINVDGLIAPESVESSSLAASKKYTDPNTFKEFMLDYWRDKTTGDVTLERYYKNIQSTEALVLHEWAKALVDMLSDNKALENTRTMKDCSIYLYGKDSINHRNNTLARSLELNMLPISGCGHWPMLEKPDYFWTLVACTIALRPTFDATMKFSTPLGSNKNNTTKHDGLSTHDAKL